MNRKKPEIAEVQFNYIGTQNQFNQFLKMLVHDYLAVDDPYIKPEENSVALVESGAA